MGSAVDLRKATVRHGDPRVPVREQDPASGAAGNDDAFPPARFAGPVTRIGDGDGGETVPVGNDRRTTGAQIGLEASQQFEYRVLRRSRIDILPSVCAQAVNGIEHMVSDELSVFSGYFDESVAARCGTRARDHCHGRLGGKLQCRYEQILGPPGVHGSEHARRSDDVETAEEANQVETMDARMQDVAPARSAGIVEPFDTELRRKPLREYECVEPPEFGNQFAHAPAYRIEAKRVSGHAVNTGGFDHFRDPLAACDVRRYRFFDQQVLAMPRGLLDDTLEKIRYGHEDNGVDVRTCDEFERIPFVVAVQTGCDFPALDFVAAANGDQFERIDVSGGVTGITTAVPSDADDTEAETSHGRQP